jgi:hypothetical protein
MTSAALKTKISKSQRLVWSIGSLMPLWLVVINLVVKQSTGVEVSGVWIYVSVTLAAATCAVAIAFSRFSVWQRVALIMASWVLLVAEVLLLAAIALMRNGLEGVL